MSDGVRYREAMEELRRILRGIEDEAIDLDELSEKVERAAALIRLCRERIERAEMRVQKVLTELEEKPAEEPPADKPD